jgi:phospholipid/cholesterol/gamma-HCH transport system substrate-binding protein
LGDKYVYIIPADSKNEALKNGDYLDTAVSTDFMNIISEKGGEATKVFEIIDEVYKLSKVINKDGRSEKIFSNLADASYNLKTTSEEASKLITELRGQNPAKIHEAIEKLNSILSKIDRGDGTLGALINDPSLHDQLKTMLGGDQRKKYMKSLIRTSIEKSENSK